MSTCESALKIEPLGNAEGSDGGDERVVGREHVLVRVALS